MVSIHKISSPKITSKKRNLRQDDDSCVQLNQISMNFVLFLHHFYAIAPIKVLFPPKDLWASVHGMHPRLYVLKQGEFQETFFNGSIDVGTRWGGALGACPPRLCNKKEVPFLFLENAPFLQETVPSKRRTPPPTSLRCFLPPSIEWFKMLFIL